MLQQPCTSRFFQRKDTLKTLIFGYGNADRQDDGVAWHVLRGVMSLNGISVEDELEIHHREDGDGVDYEFQMQLMPELADDLNQYDRVCFVDAHTGAVPEDVHFERVTPVFQRSPFTHHLTPASLLSIAETIHHRVPETILVSVRGYDFGFSQSLSPATQTLTRQAVNIIMGWLQNQPPPPIGEETNDWK